MTCRLVLQSVTSPLLLTQTTKCDVGRFFFAWVHTHSYSKKTMRYCPPKMSQWKLLSTTLTLVGQNSQLYRFNRFWYISECSDTFCVIPNRISNFIMGFCHNISQNRPSLYNTNHMEVSHFVTLLPRRVGLFLHFAVLLPRRVGLFLSGQWHLMTVTFT